MSQKGNNKAKEYMALLKQKTIQDLTLLRDRLLAKFKAERSKISPNKNLVHDYGIQLSLIGREIKKRLPIHGQGDNFGAMQETAKPKSFSETLREKTLDDLNSMLKDAQKEVDEIKESIQEAEEENDGTKAGEDRLESLSAKVDAIKAEIDTRSKKDAENAKQTINDAEGKILGIDRDYIVSGIIGGAILGVIGNSIGKNVWGFSIVGIGIGTGLVWLSKNNNTKVASV